MDNTPFTFLSKLETSETIHIGLNFSPVFDMNNGRYFTGLADNEYLNGGITANNAVVGGSNTQKTGMLILMTRAFLHRFPNGIVIYADSESTLDVSRLSEAVDADFGIDGYFEDEVVGKRFFYQAGDDGFDGTYLHNMIKDIYKNYQNNKTNKAFYVKVPFLDKHGKQIEIIAPILIICDSLSELRFNDASAKFQEGDVDEGGKKRTRDMEFGNLKRVVFEDASHLGGIAGLRLCWVGQTADIINMDGKPLEKQSTFIRQGKKIDKCPKAILRLPSMGIEIIRGAPLKNDQEWMYPNPNGRDVVMTTDARENPDLLLYSYTLYRNKGGASGVSGSFIGSQSDGIQEGLSMYHSLKQNNYFGINIEAGQGSKVSHACYLMPEFKVGRTTVWEATRQNKRFFRAITLCYHLMIMQTRWLRLDPRYRIEPKELYQIIKDKGYDWDQILDSVDYFHLNPDIMVPTITAKQLLRVALGESDVLDGHPLHGRLSFLDKKKAA